MADRYKKLFTLEGAFYKENAPVMIKAGALVSDTENGRLHVQLKFRNLSEKQIIMLKAKLVLMDAIRRACSEFKNKASWNNLTKRIMSLDYSWNTSAMKYIRLYEKLIKNNRKNNVA